MKDIYIHQTMDEVSNIRQDCHIIDTKRYLKYMSIVTLTLTLSNPIELVKSRIQTSPELIRNNKIQQPYRNVLQTFARVVSEQGFRGLWKGVVYYVLRTLPANIGVFTVKQLIHRKLTRFINQENPNKKLMQQLVNHYVIVNSIIGGIAGLAIQILVYPFEYFRIILSNQIQHPGYGIIKRIKETIHRTGYFGIFKGIFINLFYMASARAVYFGLYDSYKTKTERQYLKFMMSYASISIALWLNFPLDTVRKRLILAPDRYSNSIDCFVSIVRKEGLTNLFSGWRAIFLQSISFSTLFYLYDIIFTEVFNKKQK